MPGSWTRALLPSGPWKHPLFEEALRSQLIIKYPGLKSPGQSTASIVETLDISPTSCELAELEIPENLDDPPESEFYDHRESGTETENIAEENPRLTKELASRIDLKIPVKKLRAKSSSGP